MDVLPLYRKMSV